MKNEKEKGKWGEDIAADWLVKHGYSIVQRNWTFGKEEIDIIAQQNNKLVIVEVKVRESDALVHLADVVSKGQQKRLINAAEAYITENDLDLEARFDIIAIAIDSSPLEIIHIEEAFYPTL